MGYREYNNNMENAAMEMGQMGMESWRKAKRRELAKNILMLIGVVTFFTVALAAPNIVQLVDLFRPRNHRDRLRLRRALSQLERKKLIATHRKGVSLTALGVRTSRFLSLDTSSTKKARTWDGRWRIVLFDIPEEKQRARRALSFKLSDLGLFRLQDSVFVFPHSCEREIKLLQEFFFLSEKELITLTVPEFPRVVEKAMRVHFHLPS